MTRRPRHSRKALRHGERLVKPDEAAIMMLLSSRLQRALSAARQRPTQKRQSTR